MSQNCSKLKLNLIAKNDDLTFRTNFSAVCVIMMYLMVSVVLLHCTILLVIELVKRDPVVHEPVLVVRLRQVHVLEKMQPVVEVRLLVDVVVADHLVILRIQDIHVRHKVCIVDLDVSDLVKWIRELVPLIFFEEYVWILIALPVALEPLAVRIRSKILTHHVGTAH